MILLFGTEHLAILKFNRYLKIDFNVKSVFIVKKSACILAMIHLEFINLIIPKAILEAKYTGGLAQYRLDMPANSLMEDKHLTRFGAMHWQVIENVTEVIITKGLEYAVGRSNDFTVMEPLNGLTWHVDWIDITDNTCIYKKSKQ